MTPWALVQAGLRALAANQVRSFLTMLGIVIGIASVIALLAIGAGAKKRLLEQMSTMGRNVILVVPGSTTSGGMHLGPGAVPTLTNGDARAVRNECPSIDAVAPTVRGGEQAVFGNQNWSTTVTGVTSEYFTIREWQMLRGRVFTKMDNDGATKTCILGQTVAEKLFGAMDPISQVVRIQSLPFTVVGLLDKKGQSAQGSDQDDIAFVPLRTAQRRLFGGPFPEAIQSLLARARDASSLLSAQDEINALLRQRHRIPASQSADFTVQSLAEIVSLAAKSAGTLSLLLGAIASISLIVGGIGIMNIMLVSVTERTREIGIRMAVGARRRDVLLQFLLEAALLTTLGGIGGIGLGLAVSTVSSRLLGWSPVISTESVVLAVVFSTAVGIFFGLYPARRAASLEPIVALRSE